MRHVPLVLLAVLGLLLCGLPASAQTTIVVPAGTATVEGNSSTGYPWNTNNTGGHRIQYCYDSSNFAGITMPILIQQIRWRANGSTTGTWAGGNYPGTVIDLSSAAFDQASLTTTFATNHGLDRTNVFTGTAVVIPGTASTSPNIWYVTVVFQSPFLYDPTAGNDLLIDITLPGARVGGTSYSLDVQSTGSLTSRMYSFSSATSPTGSFQANVGAVIEVGYVPATGLYPNFDADVKIGAGPLKVTFTDKTFTSDPGGVTSWAWDFDGDSKIDSTLQNPIWTYLSVAKTATYDVTLTVTDAANPAGKFLTKKAFITVDPPPVADFSATPTMGSAPLRLQFTDLSVGATAWKWDFNNDTIVDSTVQNPLWIYPTPGVYSVRLDVSGVGGSDFMVKTNYVTVVGPTVNTLSPEILQYQLNEVRTNQVFNSASTTLAPAFGTVSTPSWQGDPGRFGFKGNEAGFGCIGAGTSGKVDSQWPVDVKGGITIEWWQRMGASAPSSLAYFFGDGTFRCFTGGVAGTSLYFRGTGIGDVKGTYDVQTGMTGKWVHVALVVDDSAGSAMFYFDGVLDAASVTSFTPATFSYSGTRNFIVAGSGTSTVASATYDIDDFRFYGHARTPAQILGDMVREVSTTSPFDAGCTGPASVPQIMGNSAPSAGLATFGLNLSAAEPNTPAVFVLGAAASKLMGSIALPWSLGSIYGPLGCNLHVDLAVAVGLVTDAGGAAFLPLPIPAGTAGAHAYGQFLLLGTKGAVTPGLDINIEN